MEYVKNGSLINKLGKTKSPMSPTSSWKYFRDLVNGLHYRKPKFFIIKL